MAFNLACFVWSIWLSYSGGGKIKIAGYVGLAFFLIGVWTLVSTSKRSRFLGPFVKPSFLFLVPLQVFL
jgi:hypothetical protein